MAETENKRRFKKAAKKGEEKEPELFKAGRDDQVISSNLLDHKRK